MGWSYLRKTNYEKAIEHFNEAIRRNPKLVTSFLGLSFTYYSQNKLEDSDLMLQKALSIKADHHTNPLHNHPKFVECMEKLGDIYTTKNVADCFKNSI